MFKSLATTGKGEQTRQAIFDCALRLFRENDFDSTTMRDIADRSGVAVGAAYYYFSSKEAIIQAYYKVVQEEHKRRVAEALELRTLNLRERLQIAMQSKLDIVQEDRNLLGVVFRYTGEPNHPLSCLGPSTEELRRDSIDLFIYAIGSERLPKDLRLLLPVALWALQMGLLILLIYDNSPGQQRTRKVMEGALDLTMLLLGVAKNPLMKRLRVKIVRLLQENMLLPDFDPALSRPEKP